jgi:hypothetical protein
MDTRQRPAQETDSGRAVKVRVIMAISSLLFGALSVSAAIYCLWMSMKCRSIASTLKEEERIRRGLR